MSERFVPVEDLVTIDEIAQRLHWSVNAATNIAMGRDGRHKLKFPKPLVGKAKRGVWLWPDVEEWFNQTAPQTEEGRRRAAKAAAMTYRKPNWRSGPRR